MSVDALYEEARDEAPFANGDEGDGWMANWCNRCWHDRDQRGEEITGPGCPLVAVALMGRTPIQWLDQKKDGELYARAGQYQCINFRDEEDGPGGEPQPIPDPPGQLTLLPREDVQGVRMLTPLEPVSDRSVARPVVEVAVLATDLLALSAGLLRLGHHLWTTEPAGGTP